MLVQSANANKPVHVQMYNCLLEVGSQNKFVIRACHWARTNCGSFSSEQMSHGISSGLFENLPVGLGSNLPLFVGESK